jgi:hypothetical protein
MVAELDPELARRMPSYDLCARRPGPTRASGPGPDPGARQARPGMTAQRQHRRGGRTVTGHCGAGPAKGNESADRRPEVVRDRETYHRRAPGETPLS